MGERVKRGMCIVVSRLESTDLGFLDHCVIEVNRDKRHNDMILMISKQLMVVSSCEAVECCG